MRFAVFFRNLNLGRLNCPTSTQFEAAFHEAGASDVTSFLTNGTLSFAVCNQRAAERVVTDACTTLASSCGMREAAFLRPMTILKQLIAADPFASVDRVAVYACCVTFVQPDAVWSADLPRATTRRDVEIIHGTPGAIFSVVRQNNQEPRQPECIC